MYFSIYTEASAKDVADVINDLALAGYGVVWVNYKKPGFIITYKNYVPPTGGFLLMEDSGFILLEDGDRIELES